MSETAKTVLAALVALALSWVGVDLKPAEREPADAHAAVSAPAI